MYLINLQAEPKKGTEYYEKVAGAFVSVYIDYADAEGAIHLAKYYTEEEGWKVDNVDDEFFEIEDEKELDKENREFYDEAKEYGYTMVFNCYESDEEE
ncbi:hypothetical protein BTO06_02485 [Tenacibaculum sp. SZ-18]|jgi:hypothetical protein|uniref:hypothetical protein n=1 Tax=Tenacibaculum sp. SZ-18 TaxID=754423 RepID=UPI000C2D4AD3|nr:hypothetical protein [Tenacibaculum sp. SZ-18]AUC14095.1 hypothetical protein BTO06_02485 [Tenacibaculum sp. SZ-18]MCH2034875.1 hypothetical protein [Tenacibaculum sp.]